MFDDISSSVVDLCIVIITRLSFEEVWEILSKLICKLSDSFLTSKEFPILSIFFWGLLIYFSLSYENKNLTYISWFDADLGVLGSRSVSWLDSSFGSGTIIKSWSWDDELSDEYSSVLMFL